jgi:hypothetical protein
MRARVIGFVASVAAMLAGCNGILGFGDFVKVDCVDDCGAGLADADAGLGAETDADAGFPDVREADAPVDAGPDVEVVPLARLWARWPMPTAESSPDGAAPYFTDGGETIFDPVTKLTWSTRTDQASSYEDALAKCTKLGGTVPTRIELATLIDTTHANPAWNPAFGTPDAQPPLLFWTASHVANAGTGTRWTIDFALGAVKTGSGRFVRCVRLP